MNSFSPHNRSDLEDLLAIMLKHAGVQSAKSTSKQLLIEVEKSIAFYHQDKTETFQQGPARIALLKLWRSAEKESDKASLINLLSQLPYGALSYLEKRALRLSGPLNLGDISKVGLLNWADNASVDALKKMILFCAAEGRQISHGRKRSNSKQSRNRVEPVILGIADRTTPPKNKDDEPIIFHENSSARSKVGRDRIDEKITLITMLANDWFRMTGSLPIGGREEENPFTEFVTSIFSWAKIDRPQNALRVYWSEMKERKSRSAPDFDSIQNK